MAFQTTNGLQKLDSAATGAAGIAIEANWLRLGYRYAEAINAKGHELDGTSIGAEGDDTTDDTTALQAAIDEAAAQSLPLFIPAGTYLVSSSLTVPSNAHIYGVGRVTLKLAANSDVPILTNSDTTNGNSGIVLQNLICDGNLANQTKSQNSEAYSVLYFVKVTESRFLDLDVSGGYRHGTFPTVSARGEGLELIECKRCLVRGGYYHDNTYDGIKLKGGEFNAVDAVFCRNNGRSGVQLYYPDGGSSSGGEKYCTLTNISVEHTTGTPSDASPQTSGVYFHSGSFSTLNGLVAIGMQEGIGSSETAVDNCCSNLVIRNRQAGSKYAIDLSGATRWAISNFNIRGLSGAAGGILRLGSNYHTVTNGRVSRGDGTGTWTITLTGNNHILSSLNAESSNVSITDSSTGSILSDIQEH